MGRDGEVKGYRDDGEMDEQALRQFWANHSKCLTPATAESVTCYYVILTLLKAIPGAVI